MTNDECRAEALKRVEESDEPHDEEFAGETPAVGIKYQVIRDEWLLDRDPPLRIIHEWRLAGRIDNTEGETG